MSAMRVHSLVFLSLLAFSNAYSQGAATSPTPTTLWRFLGIPQGVQKVRDVITNRRGNRPGMERRDPLKRLADPANLESDNPAIKAAAEVKKAEDMKMQKIKAIKYLATIGCGCYDKDGKITEALIASTDDCNPDVRMAAVEAIDDATSRECCRKCGSTSCCNEEIAKRLSELAYERDDSGCPLEANAETRNLAKKVLRKCCPGGLPFGPIEEEFTEDRGDDTVDEDNVRGEPAQLPRVPGEPGAEEIEIPGEADSDATEEADVLEAPIQMENAGSSEDPDLTAIPNDLSARAYWIGNLETSPSDVTQEHGVRFRFGDSTTVRGNESKPATLNSSAESSSAQPVPTKSHTSHSRPRTLMPIARRPLTPPVVSGPVPPLRLQTIPGTVQPFQRQPAGPRKVYALATWEQRNQMTGASQPRRVSGDSELSNQAAAIGHGKTNR